MKLKPKRLRVFPNPWGVHPSIILSGASAHHATMDAAGRPCGVCPSDPAEDHAVPGRMVGARVKAVVLTKVKDGEIRNPRQSTGYTFLGVDNSEGEPFALARALAEKDPAKDSVDLAYSAYYLERIQDGSLLAADAITARAAGVPFIEPKVLFPKLARAAAAVFNAHFEDKDVYATFCQARCRENAVTTGAAESIALGRDAANAPKLQEFDADAKSAVSRELAKAKSDS